MAKEQRAPGSLELVREFVNSLDPERPDEDRFRDSATAAEWMTEHGLAAAGFEDGGLARLRFLRETIRAELLFHTGDGEGRSWASLATLLSGARLAISPSLEGGLELAPRQPQTADDCLHALVAAAIYDALRLGTWARLKACRKHSCLFAFYDHSKNGSGAWCDMDVCGNRVKAQRRRARERSAGAAG
jgi:predicted RNA-binding Zn ribbon-like protein